MVSERFRLLFNGFVAQPMAICLIAATENEPLLRRLSPSQRGRVLLALAGLVLLGLLVVAMIWLAGRYWRKQVRRPLPPTSAKEDDWARKPLVSDKPPVSDEMQ